MNYSSSSALYHSENLPLLPKEELLSFVKYYFKRSNKYLAQVKDNESPIYIFEPSVLMHQANKFQTTFNSLLSDTAFYYALKSNNCPLIAKTVLKTGFGLDVSSGLELETALDIGSNDIIFSGPGKIDKELSLAVQNSDKVTVLMDSFRELFLLEEIASKLNKTIKTGVRLTTNPNGLWRKFGIHPKMLEQFCQKADMCSHIMLQGIQFHTSWNMNADAQIDFISFLGDLLSKLPLQFLDKLSFIDIGGGYWPERGEWLQPNMTASNNAIENVKNNIQRPHFRRNADTIANFAKKITQAIEQSLFSLKHFKICFEPGRWICNDAMHILMTVIDQKADDLVITDAGINAVGWERFETDYFPILNLTKPDLKEKQCLILGSLCTPHDIWGYEYFGGNIDVGDILMIPTQGAYTYSLCQNFIKPVPKVIIMQ